MGRPSNPSEALLGQLQSLYSWVQDPSVRHLTKNRREEEQAKGRLDQKVNRNLSAARTKFVQEWHTLLPWERERAVDRLLAAFCHSRASRLTYPDYHKLNYRSLCGAIGQLVEPQEAELAAEETDQSPYVQVDKLVRAIGVACTSSSSRAALESAQRWAREFMSASGLTRVKLERLEPAARRDLVHEVQAILAGVKESLHAGWSLDNVLLSADAILSRAHDSTQPPSSRFNKLVNVLHSLIALYHAAPDTERDVEQLEEARALLGRRMDVGAHPVVLTRRVAEVHFGELSLEQQVAAVENGRTLLFDLCRAYHEQKRLPDAREPRQASVDRPPPLLDPTWPASLAYGRTDWRIATRSTSSRFS
ncbi:hypothetical protein JCM9279_000402 [Rhodotorula babjevae]